jgi:hydrogenase maturation protease
VKLSPHQIGIQEVLCLAELRGCAPAEVILLGVVPHSLDAGSELSSVVQPQVSRVAELLVTELSERGFAIGKRG